MTKNTASGALLLSVAYAECRFLIVILSVVLLNVVVQNVAAPLKSGKKKLKLNVNVFSFS
jgi:hypothetical protein